MDTTSVCKNIIELYAKFMKVLENNADKINGDQKLKYICCYSIVLFDYGMDIATLKQSNRNASIEPLSRDLLECYALIKNLISYYANNTEFDKYIKFLYSEDMKQDKKIFNKLKVDQAYIFDEDINKKDKELAGILTAIHKNINEHFPNEARNIDQSDDENRLLNIVENINTQYYCPDNITDRVGTAIENNKVWKKVYGNPYPGSHVVYRTMCHSTHNNISSIKERTIRAGYAMFNTESRNILPALCLDYWCLEEVYEELDILFQ